DVDKLRKQDIIKKIVANDDERENAAQPSNDTPIKKEEATDHKEKEITDSKGENDNDGRPRKRARLTKSAQPLSDNKYSKPEISANKESRIKEDLFSKKPERAETEIKEEPARTQRPERSERPERTERVERKQPNNPSNNKNETPSSGN